jgi:hypothetical protein
VLRTTHLPDLIAAKELQSWRDLLALSLEFVAKPDSAANVKAQLPAALAGTLGEGGGFAGSLVLTSDQESRLVTVITFWSGADRVRRCAENRRWVQALLKPYIDGCLRGRTYVADGYHVPSADPNLWPTAHAASTEADDVAVLAVLEQVPEEDGAGKASQKLGAGKTPQQMIAA